MPLAPFPTPISCSTSPVAASSSVTLPADSLLAQTRRPPHASCVGAVSRWIVFVRWPVCGSMRQIVRSSEFATQTAPVPTHTPDGPLPNVIVLTTCGGLVLGSIQERVPERLLTAHTAPSPTAIAPGPLPTGIVRLTLCVLGSMREPVPAAVRLA